MKIYLVGGSVRDRLLGLPIKDRDWVVVGSTPEHMLAQGYQAVGKDFPVFLHPTTHEEYALARTERKTAPGYRGFSIDAAQDVTLEEDLARRDLTINAIAEDENGNLIDPYHGQEDLKKGILRHVSPAFIEDPVRVLRIARFAARFNFKIADETQALIAQMVDNNELEHLVPERVWQELSDALMTKQPSLFFTSLHPSGALKALFPDISRLFGVPQEAKWHPEIDTGIHVMLVLDQAAKLSNELTVRFAALCHDLGKGTTPTSILPKHSGHEQRSVALTQAFCQQWRVPKEISVFAMKVAQYHTHTHLLYELAAEEIVNVFDGLDAYRKPERFHQYLVASEADFRGRPGYEEVVMPEIADFNALFMATCEVTAQPFLEQGLTGQAISRAIRQKRIDIVTLLLNRFNNKD